MTTPITSGHAPHLPYDEAAERAVLGVAILRGDAGPLRQVCDLLYSARHRAIARAAIAVADSGGVPEIVAVKAELDRRGDLEKVGESEYLAFLIEEFPRRANVDAYIDLIRNRAWRRNVIERAEGLRRAAAEGDTDRDVLELLEDLAAERPVGRPRIGPVDLYGPDVTPTAPRWFVKRLLPRPGVVLAWAPPSGGKTFLLLRMVHELLFDDKRDHLLNHPDLRICDRPNRVLWVATEETAGRLRDRADMVRDGLEVATQHDRLLYVFAAGAKPPITLDDLPTFLKVHPAELVVLDSLTGLRPKLLDGRPVAWDRDNDAANVYCLMLRAMAVEHDVTTVLVHHTGRDTSKGYRGPTDWWASADAMFGLKPDPLTGTLKVLPEKCRDGRLLRPFALRPTWGTGEFRVEYLGEDVKRPLDARATAVHNFIHARGRCTQAEVCDDVDGCRSTVQDAIKRVINAGLARWNGESDGRSPVLIDACAAGQHGIPAGGSSADDEVPGSAAGHDDTET